MCVIIHKNAGKAVAENDILGALNANRDGFGYMYLNPETKRIDAKKGLFKDAKKIIKLFKALTPVEAAFHFRIRTHGEISNTACHPFEICNQEKHGMDIYMMHNGTFCNVNGKFGESDTQHFVNNYLQPMLQNNSTFIEHPAFRAMIESFVGAHNKVLFMWGPEGKTLRINDPKWLMHEGMNVSNRNFCNFNPNRSSSYIDDDVEEYIMNAYGKKKWQNTARNERVETIAEIKKRRGIGKDADVKERYFIDAPIRMGSTMYMTNINNIIWHAEGRVVQLEAHHCEIEFKDISGNVRRGGFFLQSGMPNSSCFGYQALPLSRSVQGEDKTINAICKHIAEIVKENKGKTTAEALAEEMAEDVALKAQEGKTPLLLPPPKHPATVIGPVNLIESVKKKTEESEEKVSELLGTPPATSSGATSFVVSHKGVEADHKERYCTGFEDSLQTFGPEEISVRDIFLKTDHDRFRWFVDNTEVAYNMFLDMVEKLVYEDFDDGLLDTEYNIVDEDVEDDPTEDTKPEEVTDVDEEQKAQEIEQTWNMYGSGAFTCG